MNGKFGKNQWKISLLSCAGVVVASIAVLGSGTAVYTYLRPKFSAFQDEQKEAEGQGQKEIGLDEGQGQKREEVVEGLVAQGMDKVGEEVAEQKKESSKKEKTEKDSKEDERKDKKSDQIGEPCLPCYGLWSAASKNQDDAARMADDMIKEGFDADVMITTDWANLNKEKWYVVTIGMYATNEEAVKNLQFVHAAGYSNAYIKYSGDYVGN